MGAVFPMGKYSQAFFLFTIDCERPAKWGQAVNESEKTGRKQGEQPGQLPAHDGYTG